MKIKVLTQKNTLLKATEANAAIKAFKRVFFLPTKIIFKIFHPLQKIFKLQPQSGNTDRDRFEQSLCGLEATHLQMVSKPAGNKSICAIGANELRLSSFGSLLSFLSGLNNYY